MTASCEDPCDIAKLLTGSPEILKALIATLQQKSDPRSKPNWIDLKAIPAPKDGEPEEKTVKNKIVYYCDHCNKWGLNKNHTSATCNKKKKAAKSQATLKANLATLLSRANEDDEIFSHIHLGMCQYALLSDSNGFNDDFPDSNIQFEEVCVKKKSDSIPKRINIIEYESLPSLFQPIIIPAVASNVSNVDTEADNHSIFSFHDDDEPSPNEYGDSNEDMD